MISTWISRASAIFLGLIGLALVFAADDVLPRFVAGYPAAGAWVGQLLGAAWFAVATLNWLSQSTLLGGIYGRPLALTNATLYFVATMVLLRVATRGGPSVASLLLIPVVLFAMVYVWLLFRGPFDRDFEIQRSVLNKRS